MERIVGCALGGGAARGLSHIGVLKVLEEHSISPRVVAGTSMGALVGALYASGLTPAEIEKVALEVDWRRMARLVDVTLPFHGLLQGKRITSLIKSIIGDPDFSELKLPFACVATDIESGEELVLTKGPVVAAVRASISVPGIFTPVKLEGRYLVDGGLQEMVPVKTCRELGADYVIGVNVIPDPVSTTAVFYNWKISRKGREDARKPFAKRDKPRFFRRRGPDLVKVLTQTLMIPGYRLAMLDLADADLAISPSVGNIGFFQFDRAAEAIALGEEAARSALQKAGP